MGEYGTPGPSAWLAAVLRPEVVSALEAVFAEAASAIAARGPVCWASGRCCNFEAVGHRLYTTGLEAAYTVIKLAEAAGQEGRGVSALVAPSSDQWHPGSTLALPQIAESRSRGGCPFQQGNLCGVHGIKPVACRVYFCDRSAQEWQLELSERLHTRVKAIHEEFEIPYRYAEWRELLERVLGAE